MGNQFMKWLFMLSYLITALVAINVGLMPFGYNFFQSDFVIMNLSRFIPLMHYIILLAGLVMFIGFIMCASGNHTHCKRTCK